MVVGTLINQRVSGQPAPGGAETVHAAGGAYSGSLATMETVE
jgi:hypothetical protein